VSDQLRDIAWFTSVGEEMTDGDWEAGIAETLTVFLNGDAISEPDERGEPIRDSSFLLLFNASGLDVDFIIPQARYGASWAKELDTAVPLSLAEPSAAAKPGDTVVVSSRSVRVLRRT
jgi:isoamylase